MGRNRLNSLELKCLTFGGGTRFDGALLSSRRFLMHPGATTLGDQRGSATRSQQHQQKVLLFLIMLFFLPGCGQSRGQTGDFTDAKELTVL